MRRAITLVQLHGEPHLRVLTDSSVHIEEQKREFKKLQRLGRDHPEYARIELWTSSNRAKSHKFRQPVENPAAPAAPLEGAAEPALSLPNGSAPVAEAPKADPDKKKTKGKKE